MGIFLILFCFYEPGVVGAQTQKTIRVKLEQELTTQSATAGDRLSVRLLQPLNNGNDLRAPAGSRLTGRVDSVHAKTANENGWLFLVFDRVELPDGNAFQATASASFFKVRKHGKRNDVLLITGLAVIGALLGGRDEGLTAGLGGALIGVVWVTNHGSAGQDLTLREGQTIQLRLSD